MATAKKKPIARKVTKKAPKKLGYRTLRQSKSDVPFMTFQLTAQSVYWLILSMLVLALGLWVMALNVRIENIYNQIDVNNAASSSLYSKTVHKG